MRIREIVLASRNPKKLAELASLLGDDVRVRSVAEWPDAPEVEETADDFAGNAALKAETVAAATGRPTLADDSGLCVDALDGAPGVYSARYAGPDADDAANNAALLAALDGVPDDARAAHYVCVLALAVPGEETVFFAGRCDGRILAEPRGAGGFGYDPLFLSDDLGAAFAEADPQAKHAVSHRGRALADLMRHLRDDGGKGDGERDR